MGRLRIETCVLGLVSTNCYLIYEEEKKKAVIVDPADDGSYILNKCNEMGLIPVAVLLTHGHFDHVMAVEDLKRAFRIPVYAGILEEELLKDPALNLSAKMGRSQVSVIPDHLLKDGDELELIGFHWTVIETPGHTSGSVCYWIESEELLLSGDTLFAESYGRTDMPGGSTAAIIRSITEKLLTLPESTMVYPGHGEPTAIGHEKRYNPLARCRG